jgi:hypothetical protein
MNFKLRRQVEFKMREEQYGFRDNRLMTDLISAVTQQKRYGNLITKHVWLL